jgi:hypothetical protein
MSIWGLEDRLGVVGDHFLTTIGVSGVSRLLLWQTHFRHCSIPDLLRAPLCGMSYGFG